MKLFAMAVHHPVCRVLINQLFCTASIRADDTDAATTQDSTVAAGGDAMGNPTTHLGGAKGAGTTAVEDAEGG